MNVVENCSDDTVVIHQLHKRVWPSAQRESLFWSHMRCVSGERDADAYDMHIVCNHDTDRPDVPVCLYFSLYFIFIHCSCIAKVTFVLV
jgi:collagen type IV alpha-3-binding protein